MTEYGKAIVEAGAWAVCPYLEYEMEECKRCPASEPIRPALDPDGERGTRGCRYIADRAARATLLAAIDKLIEAGPSERMKRAHWREWIGLDPDTPSFRPDEFDAQGRVAGDIFAILLRVLRAEIEDTP